jgi:hypothetical protein
MASSIYISPGDLRMLQQVLTDAGYTAEIASGTTATPNVAAMLLIRLFQEGTTDPQELSRLLVQRFGSHTKPQPIASRLLHADAIRGLSSPEHGGKRSSNFGHRPS